MQTAGDASIDLTPCLHMNSHNTSITSNLNAVDIGAVDEFDIIAIENFLDALSEIAISIATRGTDQVQEKANDRSCN